jgi:hypothetical protein
MKDQNKRSKTISKGALRFVDEEVVLREEEQIE